MQSNALADALRNLNEQHANQQLMNQALHHLVEQAGEQGLVLPLSALTANDLGGLAFAIDPVAKTLTLTNVTTDQVHAFHESKHHTKN